MKRSAPSIIDRIVSIRISLSLNFDLNIYI